jgi:hypothetical protein
MARMASIHPSGMAAQAAQRPVILLDIMVSRLLLCCVATLHWPTGPASIVLYGQDTVVYDPFFHDMPVFFEM